MKRRLKAFLTTAIAILSLSGCETEPAAKPIILEKKLATHVFSDNKLNVKIRNDGRDGWVLISYGTTDTSTDIEIRRRGKIERTLTDAVNGDDSKYHVETKRNTKSTGRWECTTFLKAGETKLIQLELPHHTSWDDQAGPYVSALKSQPPSVPLK